MRRRVFALLAAAAVGPSVTSRASVPVEQVEAYDMGDNAPTGYAPINFNNLSSITVTGGQDGGLYNGITFFNAVPGMDPVATASPHAQQVSTYFYSQGNVANPFVTDVYCAQADNFLNNVVLAQDDVSDDGLAPLGFQGGARVICNAYVDDGTPGQILDLQRRIDFMAASADAVVVAGAVTFSTDYGPSWAIWSSFNTLAVSGNNAAEPFDPTGSPGKQHADLYFADTSSNGTGYVSGLAAALLGTAQAANQTDAQHAAVVRSLLMAGADKGAHYIDQTANNLDITTGAGQVDYLSSLSILNNGEKTLDAVKSNTISGAMTSNPKGWVYGTLTAGSTDAVLINATQAITSVTASLNWDVTSQQPNVLEINTTDAGLIFPTLTLELVPVSKSGKSYVIGTIQTTSGLTSSLAGDNVQYLYYTGSIRAGQYALVVTGDPSLSSNFGLSYVLRGSFVSAWNLSTGGSWGTAANWTSGIPDNQAAVATLGDVTGLLGPATITLDGNRTVGQLNFTASSASFNVAPGAGGTLTIDDTGDSTGTANPLINVSAGSHFITAPLSLAAGVTVNVAAAGSLGIFGSITGTGGLTKTGPGLLTLAGINSSGNLSVNGGTLSIANSASVSGALSIANGGSVIFAPNPNTTPLVRTIASLNLSTGSFTLPGPSDGAGRVLLVTGALLESTGGRLDLGGNDLDITGASLGSITALVASAHNLTGGGSWTGNGITSTAAATDSTHLTALGVVQNNQSGTPLFSAANPFDTYSPAVGDILVKYTYVGDANLDGVVDGSDYSLIDAGYASNGALTGWLNGDFNYDGVIDGSDYALIDNAFNNQTGPLDTSVVSAQATAQVAGVAAVPEPAGVAAMLIAVAAIGRRRFRERS